MPWDVALISGSGEEGPSNNIERSRPPDVTLFQMLNPFAIGHLQLVKTTLERLLVGSVYGAPIACSLAAHAFVVQLLQMTNEAVNIPTHPILVTDILIMCRIRVRECQRFVVVIVCVQIHH